VPASASEAVVRSFHGRLLVPEATLESRGHACGDSVVIDIGGQAGELALAVTTAACRACEVEAGAMVAALDGLGAPEATALIDDRIRRLSRDRIDHGARCSLTVWEVGAQALATARGGAQACSPLRAAPGALSCDACVDTRRVRWTTPDDDDRPAPGADRLGARLAQAVRNFRRAPEGAFSAEHLGVMRFGKLQLDAATEAALARWAPAADEPSAHQVKLHRLAGMIEWHCRRLGIAPSPALARRFAEMGARAAIQLGAVAEVERLAAAHGLRIAAIKGLRTSQLYPDRAMRHFSDFDYLTPGLDDAVRLAGPLVQTLGYRFTPDAVPFSLKVVQDAAGDEVLTGHFHLVRRHVSHVHAVDVNFPGIPLGLLDTTQFPAAGADGVPWADQLAVTLAHLLKHDIAFMKDINDVLLILTHQPAVALDVIERCQLGFAARLVLDFLVREMGFSVAASPAARALVGAGSAAERAIVRAIARRGWPYDVAAHRYAQAIDIALRRRARRGTRQAVADLLALLAPRTTAAAPPPSGPITAALGHPLHTRIYLVPLLRFTADPARLARASAASSGELRRLPGAAAWTVTHGRVRLVVLPLGVFLATADWSVRASAGEVERLAREVSRHVTADATPWAS